MLRVFADNPSKVLAYRQLSRRLGVTTKGQREEIFAHLKVLRKQAALSCFKTTNTAWPTPMPSRRADAVKRPEIGQKRRLAGAPPRNRSVQAEFGQDPIVHRRRCGRLRPRRRRRPPRARALQHRHRQRGFGHAPLRLRGARGVDGGDDIRVFTDQLKFALQGDVVRVRLRSGSRDGRPMGDVVEVLKRERPEVVGRIQMQGTLAS